MMPASNNGVGMSIGFPDVKLTPMGPTPVPVPYPNLALASMSAVFSPNIYVGYMPQTTMASIKPMTLGNQAGVLHPLYMQMGGQTLGNPRILINCVPAQHLCIPTFGNLFNNPVGLVAVPSVTTTLYADADAAPLAGPPLEAESFRILRDATGREARRLVASRPAPGVLRLTLSVFARDLGTRFFNAIRENDASRGMILDLRGNGGGDVNAALALAGELLPKGTPLAVRDDGDDREVIRNRSEPTYSGPVVVLVDAGSASASEVFAATVQHHRRALIVGATTYGKATAQAVRREGEALAYRTVARYALPDGREIDGAGVIPDMALGPDDDAMGTALAALDRLRGEARNGAHRRGDDT